MQIEATDSGVLLVILVMALVTLLTRWGGVIVMSYVTINDRVKRFIQAMSASVLIAVITPIALTGDNASRMALFATAIVMLSTKKPLLSIAIGVLVTGTYRFVIV